MGSELLPRNGRVVVKISGSLLFPPRKDYYEVLANVIKRVSRTFQIAIVVGGGPLARDYIRALEKLNSGMRDLIGIHSSRLNARALSYMLYPLSAIEVPASVEEAAYLLSLGKIPVMGGTQPGQSTNAVALALAELVGADIVVNMLRGVDGVFDRDPREPGAVLLREISLSELEKIVARYEQTPGRYQLLDHIALEIARRAGIPIVFINGEDPARLEELLIEEKTHGTTVRPSK